MRTFKEFIAESFGNDESVESTLFESSLSRLWSKYRKFESGTISAFRGERSKSENMRLSNELKTILMGAGYSVTAIDGVYKENYRTPNEKDVAEKSFIVFDQNNKGTLKRDLMKLGEKYDQDSITYSKAPTFDEDGNIVELGKYYLIGTSKRSDSYPGYRKELLLGKPFFGKNGEFYSKVNGRPFVFQESFDPEYDVYDDESRNYGVNNRGMMHRMYIKNCADSEDEVIPYN